MKPIRFALCWVLLIVLWPAYVLGYAWGFSQTLFRLGEEHGKQ